MDADRTTSEFTWYSRFAIWAGAAVILAQSVAGRGAGLMSLLAVLLMGGGLVAFLAGLAWDTYAPASAVPAQKADETPEPHAPTATAVTASMPQEVATVAPHAPEPDEPAVAASAAVQAPRHDAPVRVRTEEITATSSRAGVECIRCRKPLVAGQVAAACPRCGAPQHAACWIENHFCCSTPGCAGRGSLEAPTADDGAPAR